MSYTDDIDGFTLIADDVSSTAGYKQLVAAPATAVKMKFVLRPYFLDNVGTGQQWTSKGWDSCSFLGLGFDDVMYDFDSLPVGNQLAPTNFFGMLSTSAPNDGVFPDEKLYRTATFGSYVVAAPYYGSPSRHQRASFFGGVDGTPLWTSILIDSTQNIISLTTFARNPTDGAEDTYMWEVWGSQLDNTVYSRMVKDRTSLAEGDAMFTAMDEKSEGSGLLDIRADTLHGDETSNWRNAGSPGSMNFPNFVKFKYPLPEYSLRLKYYEVRYYDLNDIQVG